MSRDYTIFTVNEEGTFNFIDGNFIKSIIDNVNSISFFDLDIQETLKEKTIFTCEDGKSMWHTHRGFNSECLFDLNDFEKKLLEREKEIILQMEKFKQIKNSIDYLKLSSEEKENVDESFYFEDEDLEEVRYQLYSLHFLLGLISTSRFVGYYSDWDTKSE